MRLTEVTLITSTRTVILVLLASFALFANPIKCYASCHAPECGPHEVWDGFTCLCEGYYYWDNSTEACVPQCVNGMTSLCYTGPADKGGVGQCTYGSIACEVDHWGACYGSVLPSEEICDGIDNNCNGLIDEGLSCTGGCGPVSTSLGSSGNYASGNLFDSHEVVSPRGAVFPVSLTFAYNSLDYTARSLGPGWTHNYDVQMTVLNSGPSIKKGDGTLLYFLGGIRPSSYVNSSPMDEPTTIVLSNGTYIWTRQDGTIYSFDESSLKLTSITDRNGNTINLFYSNGNLTSISDPFGRTITLTYNGPDGKMDSVTDPSGRVSWIGYDSNGHLASLTDPMITDASHNAWRYSYNPDDGSGRFPAGMLYSKTDPRGNVTTYEYTNGKVSSATNSEGTKSINYISRDTVTITERDNGVWTYKYSPTLAAPMEKTGPDNAKSTYVYDSHRNLTSFTDSEGNVTTNTYGYYPGGTIATTAVTTDQTDTTGSTTTYTYNEWGQITSITDSLQNETIFIYDDGTGNVHYIIDPLQNVTEMTYYSNGNLQAVTDARGNTTTYTYDSMGRLWTITDAIGTTTYTYNSDDSLLTVKDAKNHTITYGYEPLPPSGLGRLKTMTDQLQKVETIDEYDAYGNIKTIIDRKGQKAKYTYTTKNQLDTVTYVKADGTTESTIGLAYYPSGKVQTITDSIVGVMSYDYFNDGCTSCNSGHTGLLKTETTPLGRIDYTYDTIGRRKTMTVAGQPVVNYNYPLGFPRRQEIQATINGALKTFALQADQVGRRDTLAFPNGVNTKYALYDNASRLKTLQHIDPLNNVLESIGYTYDENGNRASVDRPSVTAPLPPVVTGIMPDAANRIPSFNSGSITYDDNGNMTSWTTSCGITNYTWDVRSRLVGISGYKPDCAALVASFKYDALGRRVEKTINGRTIKYLYDGNDTVQEIEDGVPTVNYIRTLNIDEPLARIELATGKVRYYHTDDIGSIIGLSDVNGQMVTRYAYGGFGDVTVEGEASDNTFQYTGRENDGTGLYYYRARYYNPELQRFITEDPIGFAGGSINLFEYVGNNPVRWIDPTGQFAVGPVIVAVLTGYGIINRIEKGMDMYNDYRTYQAYERYIQYLRNELEATKSCETDRYNILNAELEKMVLEETNIESKQATQWYVDMWKKIAGKAQ